MTEMEKMLKAAQDAGLCWTQKQLAEMAGVNDSVMSGCISGKRPNSQADAKVRSLLLNKGITIDADRSIVQQGSHQVATQGMPSDDLRYIVSSLREEMAEQRQSYERIIISLAQTKKD